MAQAITKAVALQQHLQPVARPGSQATQIEQSRAIAEVQAMVIVAQRCPRSESAALAKVLEACSQMELADRAFFKFPRGGQTVSGPSIHLACELARCWGNIDFGVRELGRDDGNAMSEMMAFAWDLETNARPNTTFMVPHKRDKKGGAETLTDMRDIYENNANNGARRLREMIFRVIPTHIKVQAENKCRETLERGTSDEPMTQRIAKTLKAFADIGISRERVETKLGMKADAMTPVDLANLRVSYQSIKRDEVTAEEEFPTVAAVALAAELGGKTETKPEAKPEGDAKDADGATPNGLKRLTPEAVGITKIEVQIIDGQKHWRGFRDAAMTAIPQLDPAHVQAWRAVHAEELAGLTTASKKFAAEVDAALAARAEAAS